MPAHVSASKGERNITTRALPVSKALGLGSTHAFSSTIPFFTDITCRFVNAADGLHRTHMTRITSKQVLDISKRDRWILRAACFWS